MFTERFSTLRSSLAGRLALGLALLAACVPGAAAAQVISGSKEAPPRLTSPGDLDRMGMRERDLNPDLLTAGEVTDPLSQRFFDPLSDVTGEAEVAAGQKANGLDFVGTVGYAISPASGTVTMQADEVRNSRNGGTSNTLRLELWATNGQPVFGEQINGFRLGRYQFSQPLNAGFSFLDVDRTVTYTPPPSGCYYISLLLLEFINSSEGFIYQDLVTFDDRVGLSGGDCPNTCVQSSNTLCLNDNRFKVQVFWEDFSGNSGAGQRAQAGTSDSGILWFFSDTNWEMLLKVLRGCNVNNHYWVFFAATTNVEFTVEVTDTQTGVSKTYFNPLGRSADAVTDTSAFATCP